MFGAAEEDDADFLAPGGGWVAGSGLRRLGTAGTTGTGGLGAGGRRQRAWCCYGNVRVTCLT